MLTHDADNSEENHRRRYNVEKASASTTDMATESEKQRIDHILQSKRKREFKACYACHQRKVKCDGELPCRTCRRRGHPEICTYEVSESRGKRQGEYSASSRSESVQGLGESPARGQDQRQNQGLGPRQEQQEYMQAQGNQLNGSDGREEEYVFSGDNSVLSILRQRTQNANTGPWRRRSDQYSACTTHTIAIHSWNRRRHKNVGDLFCKFCLSGMKCSSENPKMQDVPSS